MRGTVLVLALAISASGCAGVGSLSDEVIIASCTGKPLFTSEQINKVREQFARFEPERYCGNADPRNLETLRPDNYTPARFFGQSRAQPPQVTGLGITYKTNGFDLIDIPFALPQRIGYFDIAGQPFSVTLPESETDRQIRVTATAIDRVFLDVKDELARQYPNNPEMQQVSPATITVTFESSVFFAPSHDTWAGGLTTGDGRSVVVAVFQLSPRQKVPISWRGIPPISKGWLAHELRNAIFIQSGHPELAA